MPGRLPAYNCAKRTGRSDSAKCNDKGSVYTFNAKRIDSGSVENVDAKRSDIGKSGYSLNAKRIDNGSVENVDAKRSDDSRNSFNAKTIDSERSSILHDEEPSEQPEARTSFVSNSNDEPATKITLDPEELLSEQPGERTGFVRDSNDEPVMRITVDPRDGEIACFNMVHREVLDIHRDLLHRNMDPWAMTVELQAADVFTRFHCEQLHKTATEGLLAVNMLLFTFVWRLGSAGYLELVSALIRTGQSVLAFTLMKTEKRVKDFFLGTRGEAHLPELIIHPGGKGGGQGEPLIQGLQPNQGPQSFQEPPQGPPLLCQRQQPFPGPPQGPQLNQGPPLNRGQALGQSYSDTSDCQSESHIGTRRPLHQNTSSRSRLVQLERRVAFLEELVLSIAQRKD